LLQQGHRAHVHAVSFTADGKALLSAGADGYVRIWDVAANPEPLVLKGHKGLIRAVAFAPKGDILVSAGTDMTARLWNLTNKQQSVLIDNSQGEQPAWITARPDLIGGGQGGYENRLMGAVVAADERVFVADFGGRIRQWNSTVSDNSNDFEEADGPLWSLALSPDGRTLAAAGYRSNNVILWDVETKKKRFTLNGHSDRVWSVAFSPDGRTLVSGANDRKLRLWDVVNGKASGEIPVPTEWIYALTFAPDNRTLAVAAGDNRIRLYNVVSGREHNPLGQHPATIRALAFFPDGKTLASGSDDGTVKLWDLTTSEERITLRVPPIEQDSPLADGTTTIDMLNSSVWSLAVAKTGQALAVGDGDGRITVWRADAERDAMTTLDPVKSSNGP